MLDDLFVREILICQKCNIESCYWKNHKDKLTSLSTDSGIATFFSRSKGKESKPGASSSSKPINAIKSTQSIESFVVPANAIRAEIFVPIL